MGGRGFRRRGRRQWHIQCARANRVARSESVESSLSEREVFHLGQPHALVHRRAPRLGPYPLPCFLQQPPGGERNQGAVSLAVANKKKSGFLASFCLPLPGTRTLVYHLPPLLPSYASPPPPLTSHLLILLFTCVPDLYQDDVCALSHPRPKSARSIGEDGGTGRAKRRGGTGGGVYTNEVSGAIPAGALCRSAPAPPPPPGSRRGGRGCGGNGRHSRT